MNARITVGLSALLLAWIGACANGADEGTGGTVDGIDGGASAEEGGASTSDGSTGTPGTDDGGVAAFEDSGAATQYTLLASMDRATVLPAVKPRLLKTSLSKV